MALREKIDEIRKGFSLDIDKSKTSKDVEDLKVKYLGRKGSVSSLMGLLKECTDQEKPLCGKLINDLKNEITNFCEEKIIDFSQKEVEKRLEEEYIDVTMPGREAYLGKYHPISQMTKQIVGILEGMGFSVESGPDLESDFYNFEGLNFPQEHPARDMQDSFFVTGDLLLRTHTSNVQVRVMEKSTPPIRVIAPGRCFRNETISSRSHVFFHQVEAFYIDEHVSFADLLATMDEFWQKLFGKKIKTRYRPSFFPFVEPGLEGDIACSVCSGEGCRLCKNTGWLEVIGAGMIHPEVLKAGGIDPEKYSGYAWGLGVERLAMLLYDIKDIRLFTENDMRFLSQF